MIKLELEDVKAKLVGVVKPEFKWPEIPSGWQLEFIAYPDATVDMDLLHPVSGSFGSDDNDFLETPVKLDGKPVTAFDLCPIHDNIQYRHD